MTVFGWILSGVIFVVFGFLALAPFALSGRMSEAEERAELERRKIEEANRPDALFDHGEVPPSCE